MCGALSSAGLFGPARLLSSRMGWGELSAAGGMGEVAGQSRGRVGRVPEEQPAAAWPSWDQVGAAFGFLAELGPTLNIPVLGG